MVWFLLYWTMALYGLIFTRILQYKTVLKNEPHYQWQLRLTASTAQLLNYAHRRTFANRYAHFITNSTSW